LDIQHQNLYKHLKYIGLYTVRMLLPALQMLSGSDAEACHDADADNDGRIGIAEAVFILKELAK